MVRLNDLFGSDGQEINLPEPNIDVPRSGQGDQLTPEHIRAILCNPIYAGFGPFPAITSDKDWVQSAAKMIADEGSEQFLVNLLYALRESFPAEDD